MATKVLSDAELGQLSTWPAEVARSDLAAYFTLTVDDLRWGPLVPLPTSRG